MLHSLSIEWAGDTNQNPAVEETTDDSSVDEPSTGEAAADGTAQTDSTENVKTADTSHAGIYAALLTVSVASLIALGYVCIRKRRI